MRRSVLLAVWLGLVVSLLKGTTADDPAPEATKTPTSKPTEPAAGTTVNSTVPPPPTANTTGEPAPEATKTPTSKPTEPAAGTTVNSTVPPPPTANTTGEPAPESTETPTSEPTESTTVTETATKTTETPNPEPAVDFCRGDPCGRNLATCISLNSSYTCECQYGFYYRNENCYRGKVFPASISVRVPYSGSLQNVNSMEYEEVFNNVAEFFKRAFNKSTTYTGTVIVSIKPRRESRSYTPLNVTVTNLFTLNSTEDEASVNTAVQLAIKENQSYVDFYDEANSCAIYQCDTKTTLCEGGMFPECKCKPDLEKTEWDDRSCSVCSKSCSAENNKYCIKEEEGPKCRCMTNFKTEDKKCVPCRVGYSGEECTDNSELILIIVGSVLGAIVLILLIAVSIVSVRAKRKRNPEKTSLIKPGYSDINTSDDRPSIFPRVQTTSGHANPGYQPNNPYEMRSTHRDRFPERDYDDLYEISREPRGFRTQSRY